MKNVLTRSLTGLLYIAVIVGTIFGGRIWFWGLTVLFGVLGINEFNKISNQGRVSNTTSLHDMLAGVDFRRFGHLSRWCVAGLSRLLEPVYIPVCLYSLPSGPYGRPAVCAGWQRPGPLCPFIHGADLHSVAYVSAGMALQPDITGVHPFGIHPDMAERHRRVLRWVSDWPPQAF